MKKSINAFIKITIIFYFITIIWEVLELLIIGHTNPNVNDTIIGVILTVLIYSILEKYISKNKKI